MKPIDRSVSDTRNIYRGIYYFFRIESLERQILLVFPKDDQQMDILTTTSRRLGWSVSVAKDREKAVELFQSRGHELIIIDHRGQRAAEADSICRYGRKLLHKCSKFNASV